MPANTQPIYMLTPENGWATLTTANTATDGTGTVSTIYTAGTNGGKPRGITIRPLGTNVQTKLMIFLNNGSTNATASNNALIAEMTIPASTASNTTAINPTDFTFPEDFVMQSGYKINICIATAVSAGLAVALYGGDF